MLLTKMFCDYLYIHSNIQTVSFHIAITKLLNHFQTVPILTLQVYEFKVSTLIAVAIGKFVASTTTIFYIACLPLAKIVDPIFIEVFHLFCKVY